MIGISKAKKKSATVVGSFAPPESANAKLSPNNCLVTFFLKNFVSLNTNLSLKEAFLYKLL